MLKVLRITLGRGQSYQHVHVLTLDEINSGGVTKVFGNATFVFGTKKDYHITHAQNVNILHLGRLWPAPDGALPYERLVMNDDSLYGPGHILLPQHHQPLGIEPLFLEDDWTQPLVFTAPEGLLLATSHFVVTLESKAAMQHAPQFAKQVVSGHRI